MDLAVLFVSFMAAYWVRRKIWKLGYPVLPIGPARTAGWIVTVIFPAWLIALHYYNLYNPVAYRRAWNLISATFKAQMLGSVLMLNAVFIIRGFAGVSRPLLALIIMFSFAALMIEKLAILALVRYRWRLQRRSTVWRVLLVGSHNDAQNYLELVREHPEWNLDIIDLVSPSRSGTGMEAARGNAHPAIES
jgi:FlaA1/EpsC-like NDP-sugar epimerase